MIFPSVARLTEAGGDPEISFADLEFSARFVVPNNARVDTDRRSGRQSGDGGKSGRRSGAGRAAATPWSSLGYGDVRPGLHHSVDVDLLHRHGRPDYLAVLG